MFAVIYIWSIPIAEVFNRERDPILTDFAVDGLRIYFVGFLFAGINILGTGILSAIESVKWAFVSSILRGFVAILCCAFVLSYFFGMTGVWMAFPTAEAVDNACDDSGVEEIYKEKPNILK